LRRYHILNVDDLRTAAAKGSAYGATPGQVIPLAGTASVQEHGENAESSPLWAGVALVRLSSCIWTNSALGTRTTVRSRVRIRVEWRPISSTVPTWSPERQGRSAPTRRPRAQ